MCDGIGAGRYDRCSKACWLLAASVCVWVCVCVFVCTSVMCCNGVGGERHTDSEDPSSWQRQPLLPDEQRSDWWEQDTTLSLPLCILLLIFYSIALFSLSIYSSPHSVPPSHSYLYLSEAVSSSFLSTLLLSLVIPLLLFLAVGCSFALHFSLSPYFLSHFTLLLSLSVCLYSYMYLSI